MRTDYKWWFVRRDNDGFITEAAVRFYEGDYENVIINGEDKVVYVRSKRLRLPDMPHIKNAAVKEVSGKEAILYTIEDFGLIKTDDELRKFFNKEIGKDALRTPIDEQKEV